MRLPLYLRIGTDIYRMDTAITDLIFECGVDQLLLLHRSEPIKYITDSLDIVMTALPLDMKFTLLQVVL